MKKYRAEPSLPPVEEIYRLGKEFFEAFYPQKIVEDEKIIRKGLGILTKNSAFFVSREHFKGWEGISIKSVSSFKGIYIYKDGRFWHD